jgi:hypothetical protein
MSLWSILPNITRSGFIKSFTAVPSAKNYGLLATVNFPLLHSIDVAFIIDKIILYVPIGTVDF